MEPWLVSASGLTTFQLLNKRGKGNFPHGSHFKKKMTGTDPNWLGSDHFPPPGSVTELRILIPRVASYAHFNFHKFNCECKIGKSRGKTMGMRGWRCQPLGTLWVQCEPGDATPLMPSQSQLPELVRAWEPEDMVQGITSYNTASKCKLAISAGTQPKNSHLPQYGGQAGGIGMVFMKKDHYTLMGV